MKKPVNDDRGHAERAVLYGRDRSSQQDTQIIKLLKQIKGRLGDIEKERSEFWDALNDQSKTLAEMEDRSTSTEKTYLSLENRLSRTELKEAPIIERLDSIERAQKDVNKEANEDLKGEIIERIEESDLQTTRLIERIDEAMAMQSRMTRRIDKLVQDKQRLNRKLERLEEGMSETRNALASKALVLLTDQSVAKKVEQPRIPLFPKKAEAEDIFEDDSDTLSKTATNTAQKNDDADQDLADYRSIQGSAFPNGRKGWKTQTAIASVFVILAATAGWWVSTQIDIDVPEISYAQPVVAPVTMSQAPAQPIYQTEQEEASVTDFNDYGLQNRLNARMDQDAESVATLMNTIQPGSGLQQEEAIEAYTPPVSESEPVNFTQTEPSVTTTQNTISPDPSLPPAVRSIETEAFAGNKEAQHDIAAIYTAGHPSVPQNYERAAYWFEQAAEGGIANARYNLGVLYHQGLGVEQNLEMALSWYEKASQLGHPEAQYNLGIAHIEGIGVDYDPKRAAEYFETAAASGIAEAAFNLGLIYENGLLGTPQPDEALLWYKTAADNGNTEARRAMEQLAASLNVSVNDVDRLVETIQTPSIEEQTGLIPPTQTQISEQGERNTVSQIQKQLISFGLYPGPADGVLGPLTADAIRLYESRHNLNVTGRPTEDLLVHMLAKNLRVNSVQEIGSRE